MTISVHNANKERSNSLRAAPYPIEPAQLRRQLNDIFAADCEIHLASPLEDLGGPAELLERALQPLIEAIPDSERQLGRLRRSLHGCR